MKKLLAIFSIFTLLFFTACRKEVISPLPQGGVVPECIEKRGSSNRSTPVINSEDTGAGTGITDPNDDEDIHKGKGKQ